MTMLKGGNVVGMVLPDGTRMMNEDGSPLTWLVEDEKGDVHELHLTVGRMGTYSMFALPPFRVDHQMAEIDARTGAEAEGRQQLADGIPVAARSGRRKRPTSAQV